MKNLLMIAAPALIMFSGCTFEQGKNTQPGNGSPVNNQNVSAYTSTPTPNVASNSSSKDESPDDTADFQGTAGVTERRNADIKALGMMNAVRTARHGNYDRVVFEFAGAEMPTYHIEYIDKPVRACGSGNTVPLAGDGWLEVRFSDAQAHTPEGNPTVEERESSPDLPIIKQLKITCDFESEVTWVMGVASPNRYRVIELKDPTRLAVDIKHE
jgi:hypothetical protein